MPNSDQKGKRREREFCRMLRGKGYGAVRTAQVAGIKAIDDSADVKTSLDPIVRFEIKGGYNDVDVWHQQFKDWIEKMLDETPGNKVPTLAWRPDRGPWMFFMPTTLNASVGAKGIIMVEGFDDFKTELGRLLGYSKDEPIERYEVDDPDNWETTGTFS
jgi:Holliday junction resolvase